MRRIIDAFAEHERLLIRARTRAALLAKRRRGQRTGSVPFGFALTDDGARSKSGRPVALVPCEADLATAEHARRLRAEGRSLREVAAELDRLGIPTKKGGRHWSHASVGRLLRPAALPITATPTENPP